MAQHGGDFLANKRAGEDVRTVVGKLERNFSRWNRLERVLRRVRYGADFSLVSSNAGALPGHYFASAAPGAEQSGWLPVGRAAISGFTTSPTFDDGSGVGGGAGDGLQLLRWCRGWLHGPGRRFSAGFLQKGRRHI